MVSRKPGAPPSQEQLDALLREVHEARARLEAHRAAPVKQRSSAAWRDLLAALESYTAGLIVAGRPVPYRIRDELHLYRGLDLSR